MNVAKNQLLVMLFALGALLLWAYWSVLGVIAGKWSTAEYSHGYFVPVFSLVVLWLRRNQIVSMPCALSAWGLVPLAVGIAMRILGAYYYLESLEALSLLPSLLGLSICVGGKQALYWSWPSIAFLFFMLPLPYTVEVMLGGPLRRIAVLASTYTLQTFGFPAVAEGNVILMQSQPILVAEACSGLSMLLTFFALSVAAAIVLKRSLVDRLIIVLSALPIAIIANLVRIVLTAILAETVGSKAADLVFHDMAGWLMMPLALCLLGAEVALIDRLFVQRAEGGDSSTEFDGFGLPSTVPVPVSVSTGR